MTPIFDQTFQGFNINTDRSLGYGVYTEILDGMYRQLKNIQTHHSRVEVVRFDIRLPPKKNYDAKEENRQIRAFFKNLKENMALKRWGSHKRVAHTWVREVGKSGHGHYHIFIAFKRFTKRLGTVSGEECTGVWELIRKCSERTIGARPRFCLKKHTLNREDIQAFDNCFYHLSYLAKIRDKEFGTGNGHKGYDFSRIAPKAEIQLIA